MFPKTVILFSILFCAYVGVVLGQTLAPTARPDPFAKPQPSADANACIQELNTSRSLAQCRDSSMKLWDPINRGRNMGSVREVCCEAYGEIDCIMNVTLNGKYCKDKKEAMINHQRTLFAWVQRTMCTTIKYHAGNCDPDQRYSQFPPPPPIPVATCKARLYQVVNHCEQKAKLDWKVKPTDSPYSQSKCCSQFQTNDCYVTAAQKICTNQTEYTMFNKYYHDMNVNISKINCTESQYQSFSCFNPSSAFPPPPPPAALNCTGKIFEKFGICSNRAKDRWNGNLTVLSGRNPCCANWDVFDCLMTEAQDKCNLPELSEFEQYYNYLAQTITKVNCTNFGYHSQACKNAKHNPAREVSSCLNKVNSNSCQSKTNFRIDGTNSTNAQILLGCCQQLATNKCLENKASDKCNVTELVLFQKYLMDKTSVKCGQNQLSLSQCHNNSIALHNSWFFTAIALIIVFILFK